MRWSSSARELNKTIVDEVDELLKGRDTNM